MFQEYLPIYFVRFTDTSDYFGSHMVSRFRRIEMFFFCLSFLKYCLFTVVSTDILDTHT